MADTGNDVLVREITLETPGTLPVEADLSGTSVMPAETPTTAAKTRFRCKSSRGHEWYLVFLNASGVEVPTATVDVQVWKEFLHGGPVKAAAKEVSAAHRTLYPLADVVGELYPQITNLTGATVKTIRVYFCAKEGT